MLREVNLDSSCTSPVGSDPRQTGSTSRLIIQDLDTPPGARANQDEGYNTHSVDYARQIVPIYSG